MKKLQERLRDVSQQKQSEAWRRTDGGQDLSIGAMLADEAATALDTLEAEVARLREDRDRIGRNRDMWKGQCERQAEQLSASRPQAGEDVK